MDTYISIPVCLQVLSIIDLSRKRETGARWMTKTEPLGSAKLKSAMFPDFLVLWIGESPFFIHDSLNYISITCSYYLMKTTVVDDKTTESPAAF